MQGSAAMKRYLWPPVRAPPRSGAGQVLKRQTWTAVHAYWYSSRRRYTSGGLVVVPSDRNRGCGALILFREAEQALDSQPEPIRDMIGWTRRFICAPYPNQRVVGNRRDDSDRLVTDADFAARARCSHVCPFVDEAIEKDLFWIGQESHNQNHADLIERTLRDRLRAFLEMKPDYRPAALGRPASGDTRLKTFLIAFPYVRHSNGPLQVFDRLHAELKPEFMGHGLMLGQFYRGCPVEGIYSPRFRPLASAPWPAFAIRYMVQHDHWFAGSHRHLYDAYFPAP